MDRWQLDSKTETFLRCLLAKIIWKIKCNYNFTPSADQTQKVHFHPKQQVSTSVQHCVRFYPGPQREIFPGGTKIDAGPPKFSKTLTDKSKKVFTQIWSHFLPKIRWRAKKKRSSLKFGPIFCQKLGEEQKEEKKLVQNATTSTWLDNLNLTRQPQLFRYDVPPEPPLGGPASTISPHDHVVTFKLLCDVTLKTLCWRRSCRSNSVHLRRRRLKEENMTS